MTYDFDKAWDYKNPARTYDVFQKMLAQASDQNLSYRLQLQTQIARTFSLRGKYEEAHKILDHVFSEISNTEHNKISEVTKVRYHLERGRAYNSSKKQEKAILEFTRAHDICIDLDEPRFMIDVFHMLGIAEKPQKALWWNLKAIKYCEASKDTTAIKWLGPLYNNTGWTYHDSGDFEKAMPMFEKSLKFREQTPEQQAPILIAKYSVARCLRSMKQLDQAMKIQRDLEETNSENGNEDGYVYEEIAEILLLKNNISKSKIYFDKAHQLLSVDTWLVKNESERLDRLKKLSE